MTWHTVTLEHVFTQLRNHLEMHWGVIGHTQIKDDVLGLLFLLEKSRRAAARPQGQI